MKKHYLFSGRDLFFLILPLIIDLFLTLLVGMLDSIMVSSVGEAAVSGVSLVDQVMQLVIMVFSALAAGGSVVAGQYLGSANREKACKSAHQMVWFMFITALVLMILLLLFREPVFNLFFGSITQEVYAYAERYLMITAFSIPFLAIHQAGAAIFRTMGNSRVPMWISLLMNLINFSGNATFIYGFGMDTNGAGLATLLSRGAAALAATVLLLDPKRPLHYERTLRYRPDFRLIRKIMYVGIPNGLENGMFQIGKIVLLSLVTTFGTRAITANAVTQNVAMIQCIPGFAVNMAITTVISRCVGSGDLEQVRYYNRLLLKIMYAAYAVVCLSIFFALPLILRMYHVSEETAHLTRLMVTWHTFGAILFWPLAFGLPQALRATGDVTYPMVISMITMWLVRICGAYIIAIPLGVGALAIWIAMILDWAIRIVLFIPRWRSGKWIEKKVV